MGETNSMIGRTLLAIFFIVAGSLHFLIPQVYCKIMPPSLPAPFLLVQISGAAEILGGIGLVVPFTRNVAAWGLIALLIAVLPANIYMAIAHLRFPGVMGQSWAQWARVPLQFPLIYWAWLSTKSH
jgi:uncharacterized membrane protein